MVNGNQNESDKKNEPTRANDGLPIVGRGYGRRSFLKAAGGAAALPVLARAASSAPTSHTLEIVSTESATETGGLDVTYEFTATGEITPDADSGRNSSEENDSVTQNSDGTWTATGKTGNGFGDAFTFQGSVTDFSAQGSYELILDGQTVTADELVSDPRHHIEVVTTESPSELDYTFTTTGKITKDTDNGDISASGNDSVTQNDDGTWTADGYTGNGYGDAYYFEGDLVEFGPVEDFVEVRIDGSTIDLSQFESSRHHIEVVTTEDPSDLDYAFTTTGEITKDTDNGDISAAGNDSVTQNSDGTWTATGHTGNGYGDAYYFEGDLVEFGPVEDFVEVRIDGSTIDLSQFEPERHHIEVLTTEDPSELDYTFTTTGEITKDTDNGDNSASGNDSVSQNSDGTWTADGYTGNGYGDAYYFEGELTAFGPVTDFVEVRVDGSLIDLSQYEGTVEETTTSGSNEHNLGGGEGYPNTIPESEADYVVSTLSDLMDALDAASSGEIVYVAGDATIDASSVTGTSKLVVPSGVTLASDRGIDGAPGGRIKTDVIDYSHMMSANRNARVTGLRITGPIWEYVEYSKPVSSGLTVNGSGVEIDNVEVYGFNHAGIKLNASAHIHHSHIHHHSMDGLGYGIMCYGGQDTLIEHNRFNYNRHCVANEGTAGYEVRYNRFENQTIEYQVGTHRPGATTLKIHHNTFVPTKHLSDGQDPGCHVMIRGVPDDVADVHNNWFYNPMEPRSTPNMWTDESIVQVHVDEWTNVEYSNNHYGSDEPSADIGCPR
ncbi:right-handed parallel beta-helix repeat-containing protein [Halosimplex sp. J119]